MSCVFRVRLGPDLAEQLTQVCEATRLPVSTAIRACVEYALAHPEAWEVFQKVAPYSTVDTRSQEARDAYAKYEAEMEGFDMQAIARQQGMA